MSTDWKGKSWKSKILQSTLESTSSLTSAGMCKSTKWPRKPTVCCCCFFFFFFFLFFCCFFASKRKNDQRGDWDRRLYQYSQVGPGFLCSRLWSPHHKVQIHNIEMVQRRATRYTTNRYINTSSVTDIFESTKISNDQELIQSDPTSCPQNQKGNN